MPTICEELDYQKKQYRRLLKDLSHEIATQLEGIDDPDFEPGTVIEGHLVRAASIAGAIKVLLGLAVKERSPFTKPT